MDEKDASSSTEQVCSQSSRRRPLHTCGLSVLEIGSIMYKLYRDRRRESGCTSNTTTLASAINWLLQAIRNPVAIFVLLFDSVFLSFANLAENFFPPSANVFLKIDGLLQSVEMLPVKVNDAINKVSVVSSEVPIQDWAVSYAISWLKFMIYSLTYFGSENAGEKEIGVDVSCNNPRSDKLGKKEVTTRTLRGDNHSETVEEVECEEQLGRRFRKASNENDDERENVGKDLGGADNETGGMEKGTEKNDGKGNAENEMREQSDKPMKNIESTEKNASADNKMIMEDRVKKIESAKKNISADDDKVIMQDHVLQKNASVDDDKVIMPDHVLQKNASVDDDKVIMQDHVLQKNLSVDDDKIIMEDHLLHKNVSVDDDKVVMENRVLELFDSWSVTRKKA